MTTNYKYHHLPELEGNYTRQNIVVFRGAGMSDLRRDRHFTHRSSCRWSYSLRSS